jgi:hypothetical protein
MPDISAISAAISALNGAKDIAQAMISLRDSKAFQAKLIEFQSKLIDANSSALAAQDERATLLQRIGDLEKEVTRLKTWDAEKQRYHLTDVGDGTFAYSPKDAMSSGEPAHYICTNCYENAKKSILHHMKTGGGTHVLTCASCGTKLVVLHGYVPPSYALNKDE